MADALGGRSNTADHTVCPRESGRQLRYRYESLTRSEEDACVPLVRYADDDAVSKLSVIDSSARLSDRKEPFEALNQDASSRWRELEYGILRWKILLRDELSLDSNSVDDGFECALVDEDTLAVDNRFAKDRAPSKQLNRLIRC
ncbi:hypothetical protein WMF26_07960 [Sorangium sp. So ce185]|uniref:hypothetical protein n=1 Tax=Sorangium sp. So ce185 TaxID=3133287 RepID=UPI003F5D6F77